MQEVKWGIIGCGDVTEVKSGPAFQQIKDSRLVAVMRRDAAKASDYARRHGVPAWYDDASRLIEDPAVNAIYVATPPSTHELYTLAALQAGKPVYVEKPMSLDAASAARMAAKATECGQKLVVAHYRRGQPLFRQVRDLLEAGSIGSVRQVNLQYIRPLPGPEELQEPKMRWRVDPARSGGGLFHDLAPHQIDLMLFFFGDFREARGICGNRGGLYAAEDVVAGQVHFESGVLFTGSWCFCGPPGFHRDEVEILGSEGSIRFPVFGEPVIDLQQGSDHSRIHFERLAHVQQPMIARVVDYFLDRGPNPCPPQEGVKTMQILDRFCGRS